MKLLKLYAATLIAFAVFVCSNPTVAFAAKSEPIQDTANAVFEYPGSNNKNNVKVSMEVCIDGSAYHTEGFLSSYYCVNGIIRAVENKSASAGCSWKSVTGSVYMSSFGILGGSAEVQAGKETIGGNASVSTEAISDSDSYSVSSGSAVSFAADVSAVGFLSCNFGVTYYSQCCNDDFSYVFCTLSDSKEWNLKSLLD